MKRILLLLSVSLGVFAISYAVSDNKFSDYELSPFSSDSAGGGSSGDSTMDSESGSKVNDSTDKAHSEDSTGSSTIAADTITTETGLKYVVTKVGSGAKAKVGQFVSVHYYGRLASNGKEFDNSYKRQAPIEFALGRGTVIQGLDEAITGMAVGGERTLIIPSKLGYGTAGHRGAGIPPNSVLIFDVVLVAIK